MSSQKSLQERLVKEIESTYNAITTYKKTSKGHLEIMEHKLKSLKIMLAKVDGQKDEKPFN